MQISSFRCGTTCHSFFSSEFHRFLERYLDGIAEVGRGINGRKEAGSSGLWIESRRELPRVMMILRSIVIIARFKLPYIFFFNAILRRGEKWKKKKEQFVKNNIERRKISVQPPTIIPFLSFTHHSNSKGNERIERAISIPPFLPFTEKVPLIP